MRWMRPWALIGLVLTGCAGTPPPGPASARRVIGDANQVSIAAGRLDALPLAIAHCARYGRSAQWAHMEGARSTYLCVKTP